MNEQIIGSVPEELLWEAAPKSVTELGDLALRWAILKNPQLANEPMAALRTATLTILEDIENFHNWARIKHTIHPNTDILWLLSGPGNQKLLRKDDPYKEYPWALGSDMIIMARGLEVIQEVTAKRLGMIVEEVTKQQIAESGPTLVYNGLLIDNEAFREKLTQDEYPIPKEKVVIIDDLVDSNGEVRNIKNTADQFVSFRQSPLFETGVRRMVMISHDAHLARAIRLMLKYCRLPDDVKLQLIPVASNWLGFHERAILEPSGTLYNIFISKGVTLEPHPYEVDLEDPNLISNL